MTQQTITLTDQIRDADALVRNPHAKFHGASLKHLITGNDTGGHISLHHVRVDPGCTIGDHTHAGTVEIHDVIEGEGSAFSKIRRSDTTWARWALCRLTRYTGLLPGIRNF